MPYVEQQISGGLNLKAAATDIRDDQLQQATGCRYDVAGAVSSENGRKTLSSATGEVRGLGDSTISGSKVVINKRGTTLYKDSTSIGAFGTGTGHISMVTYNNYAYVADGATFKRYQTALEDVGLAAPSAAPTTGVSGSGNTIATGTYKYAYTFYNGVAESNFSPAASQAVTLGEQVDLSVIAAGPTGTTARRIYRTDKDGTAYFFLTEIADNTTTTATDTRKLPDEADADATPGDDTVLHPRNVVTVPQDQAAYTPSAVQDSTFGVARGDEVTPTNLGILSDWLDHDAPPTDLTHLTFLREQLFGISANKVWFSKTGQPEHWPLFNRFTAGKQTGETVRSVLPLNDALIVYTDARVYKFESVGLSFEDSRLIETDAPAGLAAEWAVAPITLGTGQEAHLYLASNAVYLFDGASAIEVSRIAEPLFTDSSLADYINPNSLSTAVMTSARDKAWLSYASGSAVSNDKTLFVDVEVAENPKVAVLPYGYTSLARDGVTNQPIGGDSAGVVYEVDKGGSNGGSALSWQPKTKDFTFGNKNTLKKFEEVVIDADLGGVDTTVTVTTSLGRTASFTINGSGRKRFRRHLPATMKGQWANVALSSSTTTSRHWHSVGFNVLPSGAP